MNFLFPFLLLPPYDLYYAHPAVKMRNKDYFSPFPSLTWVLLLEWFGVHPVLSLQKRILVKEVMISVILQIS